MMVCMVQVQLVTGHQLYAAHSYTGCMCSGWNSCTLSTVYTTMSWPGLVVIFMVPESLDYNVFVITLLWQFSFLGHVHNAKLHLCFSHIKFPVHVLFITSLLYTDPTQHRTGVPTGSEWVTWPRWADVGTRALPGAPPWTLSLTLRGTVYTWYSEQGTQHGTDILYQVGTGPW